MKRLSLLASMCVLAGSWSVASADLIVNGSFEAPPIPNPSYSIFTSIPGWTTSSGPGIELQNNVAGSPFDGSQFVELDSSANSAMYQDLATEVGQAYNLSFAYSPRPGVGLDSNGISVSWGGAPITTLALSGSGLSNTAWQVYSFYLTATSAVTRLGFAATGTSDGLGGYIDAVSVAATPEPSTLASFGAAGMAGLAFRIGKRRRQAARR